MCKPFAGDIVTYIDTLSTRERITHELPPDTNALFVEGFDDAIIGYSLIRWEKEGSGDYRVVYDMDKMIDCLVKDGLPLEEAVEYLEFNTWGAYFGPNTPIYISSINKAVENERFR